MPSIMYGAVPHAKPDDEDDGPYPSSDLNFFKASGYRVLVGLFLGAVGILTVSIVKHHTVPHTEVETVPEAVALGGVTLTLSNEYVSS